MYFFCNTYSIIDILSKIIKILGKFYKMTSVRLPSELELDLINLAQKLHTNKSKLIIEALTAYIEYKKDYITSKEIFNKNNKKYTHEDLLIELQI